LNGREFPGHHVLIRGPDGPPHPIWYAFYPLRMWHHKVIQATPQEINVRRFRKIA
jgi:hypothetical protein